MHGCVGSHRIIHDEGVNTHVGHHVLYDGSLWLVFQNVYGLFGP